MATKRVEIPFEIEIPTHWEIVTNRGIFKEYNARGYDQLQLLSVSQKDGVVLQTEITTKKDTSNDNKTNYKHVKDGDIVYNKMRMWQGAVGVSKYEGIVSPAYVILRAIRDDIDPDYFHYQYRSKFYIKQSGIYSYGLCDDMNSLRYEDFKNMKSILPPIDDQKDIVKRIKHYNEAINEFIQKKERYIELLKEYKQSKINELVTKGLDPNVKMKDSGIQWLGLIPEHWKVRRLKHFVWFQEGPGFLAKDFRDNGVPLIRISGIKPSGVSLEGCNYLDKGLVEKRYSHFLTKIGDIVLSCSASTTLVSEITTESSDAILYTGLIRFVPRDETLSKDYLRFYFNTNFYKTQVELAVSGSTITHYGPSHLKRFNLIIPPTTEQVEIVNRIENFRKSIDTAIKMSENQIQTIRKYRQSLIYELITGIREH